MVSSETELLPHLSDIEFCIKVLLDMRFKYSAYDRLGSLVVDELDADSEEDALSNLFVRGLQPVEIREFHSALPWWRRDIRIFFSESGATLRDQALFFRSFSSLIGVGMPTPKAVDFCIENSISASTTAALKKVSASLSSGSSIADAFRASPHYFPDTTLTLIELGDASNRLHLVSERLAESLEADLRRRREVQSALIYPSVLLVMSFSVFAILLFHLTPSLLPVFSGVSSRIPGPLAIMESVRLFFVDWWLLLAFIIFFAIALILVFRREFQDLLYRIAWKVPLIGKYLNQLENLRFFRALELMVSSGSRLPDAIVVAMSSVRSQFQRDSIDQALQDVLSGQSLAQSLGNGAISDPMALAMLRAAEESNQTEVILRELNRDLEDRTKRQLDQLVGSITPALIILIGGVLGLVIFSTLSAIMSLNDIVL